MRNGHGDTSAVRSIRPSMSAGASAANAALEVAVTEGVVDHPPGHLGVLRGGTDDVHHRNVFGVGACDRICG